MAPLEEYSRHLAIREARLARLGAVDARIGAIRLSLGALFAIIAGLGLSPLAISGWWLWFPVSAFVVALVYHQRIRGLRTHAQRAIRFYQAGLERLADRWSGKGTAGGCFEDPHHVYAADLDLFGVGSLFELLCAARTQTGEQVLASWLLAPADLPTIRARHAAVSDLRHRLAFRESMAIEGDSIKIDLRPDILNAWAQAPNRLGSSWIRLGAPLLAASAVAALASWAIWGLLYPLIAIVVVELAMVYRLRRPIHDAITTVENGFEDLSAIAVLLRQIEDEHFEAAPLQALQSRLASHSLGASTAISRLATIVNFVEARRNPLLAPFMLLLLYPLQTALAAERWRSAHGAVIRCGLEVVGNFEALISLSRYGYERSEYPFPEFLEGPPAFMAAGIGHPLLPATARICNDLNISGHTAVVLVSGSNMSGKSTLLRTVGITTVLAMAGAPVPAQSLRLTPLQVGASIRINDSLHEGSSRFYAEIKRLRQLFEPTQLPLLFLLDELLQGTNSVDRRIGAQGLIRALIKKGAIGLISTHDLALTDMEAAGAAEFSRNAIHNVHFQDELLNGTLAFDFKLQPGVVTKSNGIELMRSIGLDV